MHIKHLSNTSIGINSLWSIYEQLGQCVKYGFVIEINLLLIFLFIKSLYVIGIRQLLIIILVSIFYKICILF